MRLVGHWPTSECENPSLRWDGVDGRSVNRLFLGVSLPDNAEQKPGFRRGGWLFTTENKIVAMDHLGSTGVAKDQQHIGG